jgi:hypothetical protein
MTNREWTNAEYELSHRTTHMAVHTFYHKIYKSKSLHSPDISCLCRLCDRQHILSCKSRTQSLSEMSNENWNMHIVRILFYYFGALRSVLVGEVGWGVCSSGRRGGGRENATGALRVFQILVSCNHFRYFVLCVI